MIEVSRALDIVSRGLVGYIGMAAQDMKTGEQAFLNGDDPFPMASTLKIAVAVTLLDRVDAGELGLTDPWTPLSRTARRSRLH